MAKVEDVCKKCTSHTKCVNAACENKVIRCVNFGRMNELVKDTIEKVNNSPIGYVCTPEEIKALLIQII